MEVNKRKFLMVDVSDERDQEMVNEIKRIADQERLTQSQIVRRAILLFLQSRPVDRTIPSTVETN